jgi:hypothetical protein
VTVEEIVDDLAVGIVRAAVDYIAARDPDG